MADKDQKLIIEINGNAKDFLDEIDKVKKETKDLEKVLSKTAKTSAVAFAGFAASIALVTKSFADYETALVGVGKTTNIEGKRLEKFGKEFQKLSSEIPVSTNELLGIAQAAGQLGVTGEENLIKFTDTIAKLGVATDLTGEQAATALTRILNVTGEGIETIDNFGSVIVQLGNNFAATESEIVKVTTEVSRSTAVFGVSAAEAAGLATALKSVGVQAQLGGSATGRAFRAIDAATRQGGAALENLSQVTGIAGDQLRQTFEEDATGVFQSFIQGLGDIQRAGGDVTAALAAFGLKGDEILKVLPVLAKNSELVGKALKTAADETENATALNEEARRAFDTLNSELTLVGNNFTNLKTNIGEQLAPAITELLQGINKVLKGISELDKETLSVIASFLKWGAIISGVVASLATAGIAFLKLRALLRGLAVAFKLGRVAAIGFTGALTGGLSLIVGFLPEIISGFKFLIGKVKEVKEDINFDAETASLDKLNKKLEELRARRITTLAETFVSEDNPAIKQLDDEIKKLEEVAQKRKNLADQQFGTGELLIAPKAEQGIIPDFGIPEQQIPLRAADAQDQSKENLKKSEEEKTALIDENTRKRIDLAKRQNQALLQLQKERNAGSTEEEIENLQRRQAIEEEFAQARNIKNQEERDLALQNLQLKHENELAEIEEFEGQKDERAAQRREERAALDEELRELDKEQRALFDAEDQQALQASIDTQQEAEKKAADERLKRQIDERNQFKQDEIKFGTEIANLKEFFNKEEVQGVKSTSAQLAQLSRSRNSTLKGIGKAAARVNAAIATAEGAIKAYTSLAGIPLIGPALGAAAAAALVAYGVEQQQNISAAQTGGFVPPTNGGARDRVPTLLEPGELVVPQAIAPNFIQAAGLPDTQSDQAVGDVTEGDNNVVEIRLEDRAGEVFSLEQREGRALGVIGDE